MSDTIPVPNLFLPGMVTREGACSREFIDFLQALAAANGDPALQAAIDALTERLAAVESENSGDDLLAVMYGTNGIGIFGSIASGVEIRGTSGDDAILASIIFGG